MICVKEAKDIISNHCHYNDTISLPIASALGRFLAEDVLSPSDYPPFNQSAVDGYAINFSDREKNLKVQTIISAGSDTQSIKNVDNEAIRIFTGAQCPTFKDTVVMQEIVTTINRSEISIDHKKLSKGQHIRQRGEQIKKGAIALNKGTKLTSAAIAYLCSLGIETVKSFALPSISILATGDEFAQSVTDLSKGKIFESNIVMLQSALRSNNFYAKSEIIKDNLTELRSGIRKSVDEGGQVILISGGVSVGDYDFTKPALLAENFEIIFHGIAQKPGKPFLFAKNNEGQFAFGLPGNPKSALTCFYIYVLPFILSKTGMPEENWLRLPSLSSYTKKADGKTHFLCGRLRNEGVDISHFQASHFLKGFALSDVLIEVPENQIEIKKGDLIKVKIL